MNKTKEKVRRCCGNKNKEEVKIWDLKIKKDNKEEANTEGLMCRAKIMHIKVQAGRNLNPQRRLYGKEFVANQHRRKSVTD